MGGWGAAALKLGNSQHLAVSPKLQRGGIKDAGNLESKEPSSSTLAQFRRQSLNFDILDSQGGRHHLEMIQGVPKKIVHSNLLTPGHDFLTGSSNFGSQHHFQNLQAKGVYKSKSPFLELISVSKQPKLAPVQVRGNTHCDYHLSPPMQIFLYL